MQWTGRASAVGAHLSSTRVHAGMTSRNEREHGTEAVTAEKRRDCKQTTTLQIHSALGLPARPCRWTDGLPPSTLCSTSRRIRPQRWPPANGQPPRLLPPRSCKARAHSNEPKVVVEPCLNMKPSSVTRLNAAAKASWKAPSSSKNSSACTRKLGSSRNIMSVGSINQPPREDGSNQRMVSPGRVRSSSTTSRQSGGPMPVFESTKSKYWL